MKAWSGLQLAYPNELEPFVQDAPLPVLVRSCLEWLVKKAMLNQLFAQTAESQYTREITLNFLVNTMLDVASNRLSMRHLKSVKSKPKPHVRHFLASCTAWS